MMKEWALLAVLLALPGCESGPKVVTPAQPSGQAIQPDLPSPEGFVSTENTVNANPTGAWRVVNQALEGKNRRIETAAAFYREAWPSHGWTLEDSNGDAKNGPVTLVFTNKVERARVEIRDATRDRVVIKLHVEKKD
jgi:hypothetical protein